MLKKMWQPCFAQPKMLMEDHAEKEYELMMEKERKMKHHQQCENQRLCEMGIPDINDIDNILVANMETYKARCWDNFKDNNEKGAGNRGNT